MKVLVTTAIRKYTQDILVIKVMWRLIMVRHTTICLGKLVMKAMRRLAKVRCAIILDGAGDGNAKASFIGVMREGQCVGDSADVSFCEAQLHALVMALRS